MGTSMFSTPPPQGDGKIPCPWKLTFRLSVNTMRKRTMAQHFDDNRRVCDNKDPKPTKSLWTWSNQPT